MTIIPRSKYETQGARAPLLDKMVDSGFTKPGKTCVYACIGVTISMMLVMLICLCVMVGNINFRTNKLVNLRQGNQDPTLKKQDLILKKMETENQKRRDLVLRKIETEKKTAEITQKVGKEIGRKAKAALDSVRRTNKQQSRSEVLNIARDVYDIGLAVSQVLAESRRLKLHQADCDTGSHLTQVYKALLCLEGPNALVQSVAECEYASCIKRHYRSKIRKLVTYECYLGIRGNVSLAEKSISSTCLTTRYLLESVSEATWNAYKKAALVNKIVSSIY